MAAAHGGKARLNIFNGTGEVFNQLRPVVEADDEEFVLGIGGLDELQDRFAGADKLGGHGAGEIKDNSDGNRSILTGKGGDLLLGAVFKDLEIFLFEAGDKAVHGIGDCDGNEHHVHVHSNSFTGTDLKRTCAADGGRFRALWRLSGRRGCGRRGDMHLVEGVFLVLGLGARQAEGRDQHTNPHPAG